VSTRKSTHEHRSAFLIKEKEVDITMWMEKRLRDEEMTEREKRGSESLGACLVVRGPWRPQWKPPLAERSEPGGAGAVAGLRGRGRSV